VLNGADGLGEIAAGLVSQGLTILDSVKKGLNGGTDERASGPIGQALARSDGAESDGARPDGAT
jgi:flotillin